MKKIRPEELLAVIMIISSLFVTSPSETYSFLRGGLVVSKHLTAFAILFIFAILTTIYENRIQRIIDTIKSGVKIPSVTIEDQAINLWKKKYRILIVARDYLPFVLCLLAYSKLVNMIHVINVYSYDHLLMDAERVLIDNLRGLVLSYLAKSKVANEGVHIFYNIYAISVPILATYLYLLKQYNKFRVLLLSIVIASILSLVINSLFPSVGLKEALEHNLSTAIIYTGPYDGTISMPAVYSTIVLIFSFIVSFKLTISALPFILLFYITDILSSNHYFIAILGGAILGTISIPIAYFIAKLRGE